MPARPDLRRAATGRACGMLVPGLVGRRAGPRARRALRATSGPRARGSAPRSRGRWRRRRRPQRLALEVIPAPPRARPEAGGAPPRRAPWSWTPGGAPRAREMTT
jgi:hypothetical protein